MRGIYPVRMKIIFILIILFVLSLGGTSLVFNLTRNKDIQIPNLVGLTEEQVKETIKRNEVIVYYQRREV